MSTVAKLLARKRTLQERLESDPGPNEREEIERLLAQIATALSLLEPEMPPRRARNRMAADRPPAAVLLPGPIVLSNCPNASAVQPAAPGFVPSNCPRVALGADALSAVANCGAEPGVPRSPGLRNRNSTGARACRSVRTQLYASERGSL
jgi:hypothetical protein